MALVNLGVTTPALPSPQQRAWSAHPPTLMLAGRAQTECSSARRFPATTAGVGERQHRAGKLTGRQPPRHSVSEPVSSTAVAAPSGRPAAPAARKPARGHEGLGQFRRAASPPCLSETDPFEPVVFFPVHSHPDAPGHFQGVHGPVNIIDEHRQRRSPQANLLMQLADCARGHILTGPRRKAVRDVCPDGRWRR